MANTRRDPLTGRFLSTQPTIEPEDIFEPEPDAIQPRRAILIDAESGQRLFDTFMNITQPDDLVTPVPPRLRKVTDNRLMSKQHFGYLDQQNDTKETS